MCIHHAHVLKLRAWAALGLGDTHTLHVCACHIILVPCATLADTFASFKSIEASHRSACWTLNVITHLMRAALGLGGTRHSEPGGGGGGGEGPGRKGISCERTFKPLASRADLEAMVRWWWQVVGVSLYRAGRVWAVKCTVNTVMTSSSRCRSTGKGTLIKISAHGRAVL